MKLNTEMQSIVSTAHLVVSLSIVGLMLLGCNKERNNNEPIPSGNETPGTSISAGNNSALISGAMIGNGSAAVENLRKQISVTVLGPAPSFTVGAAFATRSDNNSNYAYIILPVTNTGSQALCLISLSGVIYRDSSGAAILSNGSASVSGSVGNLSSNLSTIFTNSCLAPGETGIAADIKPNLYSAVEKMEFTIASYNPGVAPSAKVIPQSYALAPDASTFSKLTINVSNVGSGPALIAAQYHTWFLLDDLNQPLYWGFANNVITPSVVAASGTGAVSDTFFSYSGSASKLLVFIDFEDASVTANLKEASGREGFVLVECPASLSIDELMLCKHESSIRRLAQMKASLNVQP